MCDDAEQHQKDGHRHHDHIVADACADVQPAAIVLHQEEKMQSHQVRDNQNDQEQAPRGELRRDLNGLKGTHHYDERNDHLPHHKSPHDERVEHGEETINRRGVKAIN